MTTMATRLSSLLVFCCVAAAAVPASLRAQALPGSVEALYADAVAKESAVQKALALPDANRSSLKAVRTVVNDFEAIVRQFPTSAYCDDALWRAARVSMDAFDRFGEPRDQAAAARLLQLLVSEYPTSKLARLATPRLAALPAKPQGKIEPSPPVAAGAPPPDSAPAPRATAPLATIKGIRRSVLADSVRVIIELDTEVPFHDERLSNPSRVFVDLASTKANTALIDQTIRFESDADVVRQIRVGRHPNQTTRIVLDADGVSSYSVYPLYSPYRLVIDCLRAAPANLRSAKAAESTPIVATAQPAAGPTSRPSVPPPAQTSIPPAGGASLPAARQPAVGPTTQPPARPATRPPVPQPSTPGTGQHTASSATASPDTTRPSWATPIKPAPLLSARRLPQWSLLPPALAPLTSLVLPELALPEPTVAKAATPAKLPTTRVPGQAEPAPTPATAVPPSRNLAGGFSIARQLGLGVSRIVIDPGHGGHDVGASGGGLTEAELVLDIALRLEKLLAKVPGVEVVLTRRDDRYIPLQERTALANRESADLFLSIHANASTSPQARGVETYFLNFATSLSTASVAARENAASGQAMATLPDVVKTIALNNKLDESRDFATHVQRAVIDTLKTTNKTVRDLGVKQAPFVVLIGAAMPSVLAEVSFLTNPQEAKLLKGQGYREKIAEALFDAVRKYQSSLKTASTIAQQE
jgi:N-acetylmuramoyl-L-alanine amidase